MSDEEERDAERAEGSVRYTVKRIRLAESSNRSSNASEGTFTSETSKTKSSKTRSTGRSWRTKSTVSTVDRQSTLQSLFSQGGGLAQSTLSSDREYGENYRLNREKGITMFPKEAGVCCEAAVVDLTTSSSINQASLSRNHTRMKERSQSHRHINQSPLQALANHPFEKLFSRCFGHRGSEDTATFTTDRSMSNGLNDGTSCFCWSAQRSAALGLWSRHNRRNRRNAEGRDSFKMPPSSAKWWQVTLFICNDVVGAWLPMYGALILGMYGWITGMILLVFMWPLNLYTAHLLWRCRNAFPGAISIGDLVFYLTRSTIAMYVTFFFVNITILFTLATQIHAVSSGISTLFEKNSEMFGGTCFALYISVTVAIMLPLTQLRYLHSLTLINIMNVLCVLVFVSVSIFSLSQLGLVPLPTQISPNEDAIKGYLFAENETGPLLGIELLYASFHYQLVILEMISEMKNPAEFPKANYWATPFIIFVAVAMSAARYYYYGESEEVLISTDKVLQSMFDIERKGRTPLAIVGVLCFSIHIMGSAVIRSVILTRFFQLLIHPSVVNIKTWRSRFEWLAVSLLVLALAWVLSLFQSLGLVSTISGILAIILTSLLPCILYVVLCKKRKALIAIPWYEWVLITFLCVFGLAIIIADFVKIGVPGADARINQTTNQTIYEVKAAFQCPNF